jgi:tetratricopeptide (TPR) repeat protein
MARLALDEGKFRQAAVWLSLLAGTHGDAGEEGAESPKPSVFFRLGKLFEEKVGDAGKAVDAYFRAWTLAPALADAAEGVLRLARKAGRFEEYIAVRGKQADERDPAKAAAVWLENARIAEEDLRNPHIASEWIAAALEATPTDAAVLEAAVRIFEKAGDDEAWIRARGKAFDVTAIRGEAKAEEAAEVARLCLDRLSDPESAVYWFSRAAEIAPLGPEALREWRLACARAGASRQADRVFLLEIAAATDPAAKAGLFVERAAYLSASLGDEAEAVRSLRESLRLKPKDARVWAEIETLARRSGRWRDAAEALLALADLSVVDAEKAGFLEKAGDLLWDRLSDPAAAKRAYRRALEIDPSRESSRARLEGTSSAAGEGGRAEN